MQKQSQIPPETTPNPLKNHRKTLKNATSKHLAKKCEKKALLEQKNAILEPTWCQLRLPKQKNFNTRRDTRRPLRGASLHHKGMGCPDASHPTRWWVYETPAHCDASRISAGVHFRESALARRNHAKHFQNLPTMCSKGPKSSKIYPQTPQNLTKAFPKRPQIHPEALLEPILNQCLKEGRL